MSKSNYLIPGLIVCLLLAACGKPAAEKPAETQTVLEEPFTEEPAVDYGRIEGDFSGLTPEIAGAYLAVVDEIAGHLGYDGSEAAPDEYLHGGFVSDWDGDGTPELCLLLKTSPRDSGGWDGTPLYGWNPPALYLYTFENGQAVRAGECDLYFATGGREAAVAALTAGDGMRFVRWDRSEFAAETYLDCYTLVNGTLQKIEVPADAAAASQGAETAQAFLDALGAEHCQLLLYNSSGDARLEGEPNAPALREALAAKASREAK